ncbi:AAA family ATPase [Arcobacter sp.]|uniref:AAA family ATPase n=1 Tax=unclassified Arcobacter TaxID=2593671 RepID=UPI003AFF9E06
MYLSQLNLKDFKSHEDNEVKFKNITLLTGLNGAGKSSIFQSLRMIWRLLHEGDLVLNEYGELSTLKNTNSKQKSFSLELLFSKEKQLKLTINLENNTIEYSGSLGSLKKENIHLIYLSANRLGPTEFQKLRNSTTSLYNNVGINGEFTLDILSKFGEEVLPDAFKKDVEKQNTIINHVEKWLQEISPNVKLETELNKNMNVASFSINSYTPYNVGFGISYTLSILVQLIYSLYLFEQHNIKSVILIENPEAHLHPKGQTKLAEFISKITNFGIQIIIETHSDYILDGLRISVKDKEIEKDKAQLHYFELDKNLNTKVLSPKIGEEGHLDEWPENFFDTSLNNKMRLM